MILDVLKMVYIAIEIDVWPFEDVSKCYTVKVSSVGRETYPSMTWGPNATNDDNDPWYHRENMKRRL